jgi:phosphomannomutase
MADSLKFGTSGLRGLAVDLVGPASARYTAAFLDHLGRQGLLRPGDTVLIGRDLRESSPAIAEGVTAAIRAAGCVAVDCGQLPTPGLALAALDRGAPAIMVTGSHIPADRNGLKFYLATGEITKADEAGILDSLARIGKVAGEGAAATSDEVPRAAYLARYRSAFGAEALAGLRIGVFQHSSVARDDLVALLDSLGADVVPLGRADHFVPIDTEALGVAETERARNWVRRENLDALVSTDGDADRPLVADETGAFIRGDILGILTAQFLGADAVVTPVTSNSAIEDLGAFTRVLRTRVGSPYVIESMEKLRSEGARTVVGFEANGGVLLGSPAAIEGRALAALPTRDAMLPILAVLAMARAADRGLGEIVSRLPSRIARSDRLEHVPPERTAAFIAGLADPGRAAAFFAAVGEIASVSDLDGLRFVFRSGDVLHYRASGNAPELRCYSEAATAARADELLAWGLGAAEEAVRD